MPSLLSLLSFKASPEYKKSKEKLIQNSEDIKNDAESTLNLYLVTNDKTKPEITIKILNEKNSKKI